MYYFYFTTVMVNYAINYSTNGVSHSTSHNFVMVMLGYVDVVTLTFPYFIR